MVDMYLWQALCAARGLTDQELRRGDPYFRKDWVRWWPKVPKAGRAQAKLGLMQAREDTRRARVPCMVAYQLERDPSADEEAEVLHLLRFYGPHAVPGNAGLIMLEADPNRLRVILREHTDWRVLGAGDR